MYSLELYSKKYMFYDIVVFVKIIYMLNIQIVIYNFKIIYELFLYK